MTTTKGPDVGEPALRRWILLLLVAVVVVRTGLEYRTALAVEPKVEHASFASFFKPGVVDSVRWLRGQSGARVVHDMPEVYDRYLCQRMSEMLYPLPYQSFTNAVELAVGDYVVLPGDATLERPSHEVFRQGDVHVVRVAP